MLARKCSHHLKFSESEAFLVVHSAFHRPMHANSLAAQGALALQRTALSAEDQVDFSAENLSHNSGSGIDLVNQRLRNQLMHSVNGNTRVVLLLDYFVDSQPMFQYSRSVLLSHRHNILGNASETFQPPRLQTTPPCQLSASTRKPTTRTGKRLRIQLADGSFINYKPKAKVPPRGPDNSRINKNSHRVGPAANSASERHAGNPFWVNEARTPPRGGTHTSRQGARFRRLCRRAYRKWRRECNLLEPKGADSLLASPPQSTKVSQSRAAIFRNTIEWQTRIERKKKPTRDRIQTTPPLAYNYKLRVGAQNVQGLADTLKIKNLILMMQEHHLQVLILSETKSTAYYSYTSEQHLVIQSGNYKDRYAGIGAIIHPSIRPYLADVVQVSNRIIHLTFNKKGGRVHIIGVYAPHSGHDHDAVRQPFWESLEEYVSKIPQPEPVYVTGDFNVRFQATHPNDQGVTGPFTYGKGRRYIDHSATSNRSLCFRTMNLLGMLEVASYKTPNPVHHITFKDKAAPPTDWSQFIMDPLVMQQFYDSAMNTFGASALAVCSQVRSFLDLAEPLPPSKNEPHPDPTRFQRLDHCFVRSQWLSTVNSCRSKLHTGYPSDHYLLVTEIQIKLASRKQQPRYRPKIDFSKVDHTLRDCYNRMIQGRADMTPPLAPDHTAKITFYTDGAGTKGKATRVTPAGWGWCVKQGQDWIDACGPVCTDPSHIKYLGARIGSNNTGEITAIIEALLFALEHEYTHATILSDSQWAINMITGKWRPKTNKDLVFLAQKLAFKSGLATTLHWVKGHAGQAGNERADQLAAQGRDTLTYTAGRTVPLPGQVPASTPPSQEQAFDNFTSQLTSAAKQLFPLRDRTVRKPWISEPTLRALAAARAASAADSTDWKSLRNMAKRLARKDRVKWIHDQLTLDPSGTSCPRMERRQATKTRVSGKAHAPCC